MPVAVKGMVSLRGALVPVVDLAEYIGIQPAIPRDVMIVAEYNGRTQGFLVEAVDTIMRLDWSQMRVPPDMLSSNLGGMVTAVSELADGRLVMMLDVERVLVETVKSDDSYLYKEIKPVSGNTDMAILFADDSSVARSQIRQTLDALGIKYTEMMNGRAAWEELQKIAAYATDTGQKVSDVLHAILTDVEMPEMDGYILTKHIKSDQRFANIPIIMHSSLTGVSNNQLGRSVGVDEYVSKFEPQRLAEVLSRIATRRAKGTGA